MTVTEQLKTWTSPFGEEWIDRTTINHASRYVSFYKILSGLPISSILEVGCGKGDNLQTLRLLGSYKLVGLDSLRYACLETKASGIEVVEGSALNLPFSDESFDLVFSSGLLMHIAPENMGQVKDELWRVSKKYMLVIEYYAKDEHFISWRGRDRLLWKRDYGNLYPNLVDTGFLDKGDGFDDCTWYLFKK